MRTRDIKPGFYLNDQLAECSFAARLAFPGLWMVADREGRMEYRPKRLKAEIFPYDNIDMEALVRELEINGLVQIYEVEGIKYLWIPNFTKHQSPHPNEKKSEFPAPPENSQPRVEASITKVESASNQGDHKETPRVEASITKVELNPASSLILNISDSHVKKESSLRSDSSCPELSGDISRHDAETAGKSPPVISLLLNSGKTYQVDQDMADRWQELYPAVDVMQCLRSMAGWLEANPKKRKTERGILNFVNGWLARKQDKGGNPRASPVTGKFSDKPSEGDLAARKTLENYERLKAQGIV